MSEQKFGYVALIGPPNAGKSTLMNTLLQAKISIVTPKVQTTRRRVLGVFMQNTTQVAFLDTPGIFKAKTRMDKAMISVAQQAINEADLVCIMIDASRKTSSHDHLFQLVEHIQQPTCVILNKIDKTKKESLLHLAKTISETYNIQHIFMTSALKSNGTEELVKFIQTSLPEGSWMFGEDDLTDLSLHAMATEYTREKLFMLLNQEVPYGLMVQHELWEEQENRVDIYQRIIIERNSHKGIVLGKHGELIKKVRLGSEKDIRNLLKKKVKLHLQVVVKEGWKNKTEYLHDQGLEINT